MSDPFYGEIRMFGGDYAPVHWAFCSGTLLNISGNEAVFSLLGTAYGGNGTTNFALPDMRCRVPMGQGNGPGLTPRVLGQSGGLDTVTLTEDQIPFHSHHVMVSQNSATMTTFADAVPAKQYIYEDVEGAPVVGNLADGTLSTTGDGNAHENRMPFLSVSFIICMLGVYPMRN
ncbi:phage tail protein [Novosphingobium beihaiensis]|uniref:Tail fiber protein n=1 Tax=Novosphingobium beihaiensis TaxID=2930389 RepID=A0ABT0BKJ1_9SPHN|nr:tail fiber protein [Novosphingobium beihaiensis]MCJ2185388.1 tail fiber protein [Novosphingobium beihaiensis]